MLGEPAFTPLAAARDVGRRRGAPRVELLLTLDEGTARTRAAGTSFERELEPPPSERQPRLVAEARVLARSACASWSMRARRSPGEIVVLLRAFTHVDAYEEALERAGLDPYVVGGRGYWSQQQVEDMLRLLECGRQPARRRDAARRARLARPAESAPTRSGCCAARPSPERRRTRRAAQDPAPVAAGRVALRRRRAPARAELERPGWSEIPAVDAERLERFCAILAELRAAAPLLALDDLVERTMTAFGYDLHLLGRARGRGRMANVRKLMRLAREFERHEGRDLRGFLASAQELTERDEREGIAAIQAEDHDGVRIMTVHAAKGLEFPVVACPTSRGRWPAASAAATSSSAVSALREDGEPEVRYGLRLALPAARSFGVWELHELHGEGARRGGRGGRRLVHVAATRAQERLILSGVFKPGDCDPAEPDPKQSAMRRLLPALAERGWDPSRRCRRSSCRPPGGGRRAGARDRPADRDPGRDAPAPARATELARRLPGGLPPPRPSNGRRRGAAAGPARRRPSPSATSPTRRSPSTSAAGTASTSSGCSA